MIFLYNYSKKRFLHNNIYNMYCEIFGQIYTFNDIFIIINKIYL
jgi:hypothetical protein